MFLPSDLYQFGAFGVVRTSSEDKIRTYDLDSTTYSTPGGTILARTEPDAPHGEWNTLELYCLGTTAVHVANGEILVVIEDTQTKAGDPLNKGQIQIQSEGAEVYYKDIRIRPIAALPAEIRSRIQLKSDASSAGD